MREIPQRQLRIYGDMSTRTVSLAAGLRPDQEIYSFDESFIRVDGIRDVTARARRVQERILQRIAQVFKLIEHISDLPRISSWFPKAGRRFIFQK